MSRLVGERLMGATPTLLRHEGVPYSGPAALVPTAAAMLAGGLREGAACLVLASAEKIDALRAAMGQEGQRAAYLDMTNQGRNPARVLPALQAFVDGHPGRPLQIIAEPVHTELSEAARTEAEFGELIFALSGYRDWPATVSCLYDLSALAGDVAESIASTHRAHPAAVDAEALLMKRFGEALSPTPAHARQTGADRTTLGDLRLTVAGFGKSAGLDAERIDDFVYAVNEVVTNSICHGDGRARVLLWVEPHAVVCEVFDRGRITDPLVGRLAPRQGQMSGRGLWLVNQLCDLVQVRSSQTGTFVRMFVEL